jgi:transcriptional regulator with XRE-family HTH domain
MCAPMLTHNQLTKLQLLADCVKKRKLTQRELESATGVHQSQVSRILGGHARRPSPNLLKLCKYAETLSTLDDAAEGSDEEIIGAIRSLLGHCAEEDQRLRDVVISLKAWRDSWRTKI